MNRTLEAYGFQPFFAKQIHQKAECEVGRVALEHKHLYRIYAEDGEWLGELSGKTRYEAAHREDYPAVGDWVWITKMPGEQRAVIHGIFEQKVNFRVKRPAPAPKSKL